MYSESLKRVWDDNKNLWFATGQFYLHWSGMLAISLCPSCFQQTHAQDTHQTTLYNWTCGSHGSYRSELSTTILWNAKNELPNIPSISGGETHLSTLFEINALCFMCGFWCWLDQIGGSTSPIWWVVSSMTIEILGFYGWLTLVG